VVIGDGLKTGAFTEEDKLAYIEAWSATPARSQALELLPRDEGGSASAGESRENRMAIDPARADGESTDAVIWGEMDTALHRNLEGLDQFVPDLTIQPGP